MTVITVAMTIEVMLSLYRLREQGMQLPVAAVIHQGNGQGDALLADILAGIQQQGWRVRGLLTEQGKDPRGMVPMQLRDLHSGELFVISQNLGRDARGCQLDPSGLAQASIVLRRALADKPDLVFINRFGYGESQGRGLSQEFALLISAGIPLLTLVSDKYLEAWHAFSAGLAQTLPLEREAIERWWVSVKSKA